MARHRRFGPTYKKRIVSSSIRKRSATYFDYLRTLDDEGLKWEYRKIYSRSNESRRKLILNKFLLENNKLDIISKHWGEFFHNN